jgi:oligopeptidase A
MSRVEANPLVEIRFPIPFDRIRAADVAPAVRYLIAEARGRLRELAERSGPRTFDNTMVALDRLTERLDYAIGLARHLESVVSSAELRQAYNEVHPEASAFHTEILLDSGLWRAIRECAAQELAALEGVRRRFLERTIAEFRRHGADLDAAGKAELERIDVELSKLTARFGQNALDATSAFELVVSDEGRLAGLPPSVVAAARESAAQKGLAGWRFTLQAPSYQAAMMYLDDAGLRERLYRAHSTRAAAPPFDNRDNLRLILDLRRRKAQLLGYADWADFVLEDRMAKSGARAQAFLEELRARTQPAFERENEELAAFQRELEGPGAAPLAPWDISYWAEKLRQARFDFQEEDLRPYFPLERVIAGLFEIVQRLFGVRIIEAEAPVWDPETKYYHIEDSDGTLLGAFYADWHPRENKKDGAWMDAFITGGPRNGSFEPHAGAVCGNLNRPAGGRPALLTHREVETIFHEFGHLLHHSLSRVPLRSLAGTNVAWDFVELPSQILENWCWEREALDLFARHWESGRPIPDELFAKMKRARTFRAANAQMRQLGFGFLDLALHREYDPERDGDVVAYSRRILERFSPAPLPEDHAMVASFTHLFADPVGYGAGYYSYKWAEVLDADAFTRFRAEGILNPATGREFREKILERGDSEDPGVLYRSFLGRDADMTALLERLGLV